MDPAGYTAAQLAEALFDVLDGNSQWYEIQENTGLNEARCKEIAAIYGALATAARALHAPRPFVKPNQER